MPLFNFKKKESMMPQQPVQLPVDQVVSLLQQGYTNDQIAQTLQSQGFNSQQIYDAVMQAQMRTTGPEPFGPPMPPAPEPMQQQSQSSSESAEQAVESIIEEKWNDLMREFSKWTDWKEKTDSRVDKLEQGLADLKSDLDGLHKAIVSKIGDYDKNLLDVGTEVKAMEKVFQKIIPDLTTSVSELSRITKSVKNK
jgi:hypothetical protein